VSFWRYKLLELVVALITAPLFFFAGFLVFATAAQFTDLTKGLSFYVVGVPFIGAWLAFQLWATKRAERWWLARRASANKCDSVLRR
jgi:protein-S-isoprenylcysteine O-methyltransferase Ste14